MAVYDVVREEYLAIHKLSVKWTQIAVERTKQGIIYLAGFKKNTRTEEVAYIHKIHGKIYGSSKLPLPFELNVSQKDQKWTRRIQ
jgi:hypothetical protein